MRSGLRKLFLRLIVLCKYWGKGDYKDEDSGKENRAEHAGFFCHDTGSSFGTAIWRCHGEAGIYWNRMAELH